jgi:hypothetical protein
MYFRGTPRKRPVTKRPVTKRPDTKLLVTERPEYKVQDAKRPFTKRSATERPGYKLCKWLFPFNHISAFNYVSCVNRWHFSFNNILTILTMWPFLHFILSFYS